MFFPIFISILFSDIALNNPAQMTEVLFSDKNTVLSNITESINHLPQNSYKDFYYQNFLPQNKTITPKLKNESSFDDFFLAASSSIVVDVVSGEVVYSKNPKEIRSIASLSKLAAALTFLDFMPEWGNYYKIKKADLRSGGRSHIYEGDEVKIIDLFHLSLIASDNSATVALGSAIGLSESEFAAKMSEKAASLGLLNTHFKDATGLNSANTSTAEDVAILAKKSFARKSIREIVLKKDYSFLTKAERKVSLSSTDDLLSEKENCDFDILGGKTGYISEAGYCFAGEFSMSGNKIISVVLGASTESARFIEAKRLTDKVFDDFIWD